MRRLSLIAFIILNVIISISVALVVINIVNTRSQAQPPQVVMATVPIIITATQDRNAPTQTPWIVTATPLPGQVILPTGLIDETGEPRTPLAVDTIDPLLLSQNVELQGTVTALPFNCIPYTIQEGDTPFGIALQYGVDFTELMAVNGLDDTTASLLQIGQVLIVPLEGCQLASEALSGTQTATVAPPQSPTSTPTSTAPVTPSTTPSTSPTPTLTFTPSLTPTSTLPPTAANAQVIISGVSNAGDVTAESISIQNVGQATVDISSWRLEDSDGITYTFPNDRRLFGSASIIVFSRVGQDTPSALFWNRQQAVLSRGETITLYDRAGVAQSTFTVP